ncbi:MAG: response regulator [Verrucomicrobia bacterium]|nr:response regulator [Verrucomicrobiota bacterium]
MTEANTELYSRQPLNVLLVEDEPADAERALAELRGAGFQVHADTVQTAHEFCARLAARSYQVVLVDDTLPSCTGLELLELLHQMEKPIPFLLLTRLQDDALGMECLRKGAYDYVAKTRLARLPMLVQRAVETRRLRDERNQARQRAQDLEQRYQHLAELSPDPLFIISDDRIAFVNHPGVEMLGANSAQDLAGKPALSLVHPDSRMSVRERLDTLSGHAEVVVFHEKLVRLDGKPMDVKIAAIGLLYHEQPAVQLVAHDISERRRVEETIKSLAAFAEMNPNPVLEFARDGSLTYANEAALQMARSLGKNHPRAMLPGETVSIVQMCLTTGQNKLRMETSIGGRTFSWSFFPVKQNQVVHCYVTDISEPLSLEAQLRHAQKLESVGRLAAGVAHDFNNVLTVIQGHTGLLRSMPDLRPDMAESLQAVSRAAERASKLTSQLLTFSRKNVIQPRRLNLNDLLTATSTLLYRALGEDITFQFNFSPQLTPIFADPGLIEQMVMNLAVNAREAMPEGGQLVISTAMVDINEVYVHQHPDARKGRFVGLSFIDTGKGMDNATLSRLFEPFPAARESEAGSGLGLATVYGIVKRHQGWIEVQSQVGHGSTFKVFLPPHDQVSDHLASEEPEVRGGTETILVVEDEPPVRWTVKNILQNYGYRVLEAAVGVDALAIWHQHHQDIALLLTDMVMPAGLNGQELAEKFKAQKNDLKIIYTSGYSVEIAGRGLSDLEGIRFLQKPYDAKTLARAVRCCLDS